MLLNKKIKETNLATQIGILRSGDWKEAGKHVLCFRFLRLLQFRFIRSRLFCWWVKVVSCHFCWWGNYLTKSFCRGSWRLRLPFYGVQMLSLNFCLDPYWLIEYKSQTHDISRRIRVKLPTKPISSWYLRFLQRNETTFDLSTIPQSVCRIYRCFIPGSYIRFYPLNLFRNITLFDIYISKFLNT